MTRALSSALVVFGLIVGASAAQADNTQSTQSSSPGAASMTAPSPKSAAGDAEHANLRQQLQSQLSGAGYTNIEITPSSFFIQAKDKSGNPVSMVVGPDSFTEVTTLDSKAGRAAADSGPQKGAMAPNSQQRQMGTQSPKKP